LSGTSSSFRTKLWWNSHWMVLFQNLCLAVTLSNQDGCHSVIALLLKAALIQVCDYRLLGGSGFIVYLLQHFICIFVNSCYISRSLFQMLLWETRECSWYCNQAVGHTPGTREMASICPYRIKTNRRLWYYWVSRGTTPQ
jgi:hypothetical protein